MKILSWLTSFCAASTALLGIVGRILDEQPELAAVDAALLVDLVDAQQHPGAGLLAEPGDRARQVLDRAEHDLVLADALGLLRSGRSAAASAEAATAPRWQRALHRCLRGCGAAASVSSVHRLDLRRVLGCTSLRLSFIVGVSSSSSAVSCVSSRRNALICSTRANFLLTLSISPWIRSRTSGRARQARVVGERDVVVLGELLDVLLIDHHQRRQVRPLVADHHRVGDVGAELQLVLPLAWRDVLAAGGDDDVLHAVGDAEVARRHRPCRRRRCAASRRHRSSRRSARAG